MVNKWAFLAGMSFAIGAFTILAVVIGALAEGGSFNLSLLYNAVISFIVGCLCMKAKDVPAQR